jgi:uncharacterized protein
MKNDSTPVLNPTTSGDRIEMIDSLRGFALTGVCLGNLALFSFYFCLSDEQKSNLPFPVINTVVSYFTYFFVDQKFWTLFSIMFGFGASVFISRANELHKNGKLLFARRLLILFATGLLHCVFLWFGDILTEYAFAGFILLLFSNKKGASLVFGGVILGTLIPFAFRILQYYFFEDTMEILNRLGRLTLDAYSSTSYRMTFRANFINIETFSFYAWFLLIAALGRFMIGYWIGQTGRLYKFQEHTVFFRKSMRICAWTGFPLMLIITATRILLDNGVLSPGTGWQWITDSTDIASLALGIFYAIRFAFLYQDGKWKNRLSVFKEMGRMALTNYLMQTIINIIIFNGFGFDLAGKIGPALYILWFVILTISQILFSKWWLKKFRFGPVEWLWRSLTYNKLQDIYLINNKSNPVSHNI